jgi:hypothetical protein
MLASRPCRFIPRKKPQYQWIWGYINPKPDLDVVAKRNILFCRESNPGSAACSPSATVTVLSQLSCFYINSDIMFLRDFIRPRTPVHFLFYSMHLVLCTHLAMLQGYRNFWETKLKKLLLINYFLEQRKLRVTELIFLALNRCTWENTWVTWWNCFYPIKILQWDVTVFLSTTDAKGFCRWKKAP